MDGLTLGLGVVGGILMMLLGMLAKKKWPAIKAKVASWFTTQKTALEARAEGKLVDLEQRLKAIEAAGIDDIKKKLEEMGGTIAKLVTKAGGV